MSFSKIEKKVISIISNSLNNKNINLDSNQENTDGWDSLAYLGILSEIEEEFKIQISEKNINNFNSVKNILIEINK